MSQEIEVTIQQMNNGFLYIVKGSDRLGGKYVCKATEEEEMLKKIGEVICGYKIEVRRK